jgi:flagellar basal-body rod protein FlgG
MKTLPCLFALLIGVLISACSHSRPGFPPTTHYGIEGARGYATYYTTSTADIMGITETGPAGKAAVREQSIRGITELLQRVTAGLTNRNGHATDQADNVAGAYLLALEVISRNIANANTCGYRRSTVLFKEGPDATGLFIQPEGGQSGKPVSPSLVEPWLIRRSFTTGPLKQTGEFLDVAIQGGGFLEVQLPDGNKAYTRAGALALASDGTLVTVNGLRVSGAAPVPHGTTSISISPGGLVTSSGTNGTSIFQLQLARFENPSMLQPIGENLYVETAGSGPSEIGLPASSGYGSLVQGHLELSNVNVAEELQELVRIHSAYEAYTKAVAVLGEARAAASRESGASGQVVQSAGRR